MRKQYHLWPSADGFDAWDVDRLVELSAAFPVRQVDIATMAALDTEHWFLDDEYQRPTVRAVIEHMQLIEAVDPGHPIILGADGRVMDGMHRVARAFLDGRSTIDAVQFEVDPEPDYRNCRVADLPDDR